MSRISLFPRLSAAGVTAILDDSTESPPQTVRGLDILEQHSFLLSFAASGGTRDPQSSARIAREIRDIAVELGYPDPVPADRRAQFDKRVAIYLAQEDTLKSGEALRDDVWAFMTVVMAPDIVAWRFPARPAERYSGGVRNAFQRLWMRGTVLDRGRDHEDRWRLIEDLSEDAMVQIFERASFSANASLAKAIAEVWCLSAERLGRGRMEGLMRKATKLILIRNEIVDLSFLPEDDLEAEVQKCFQWAEGSNE